MFPRGAERVDGDDRRFFFVTRPGAIAFHPAWHDLDPAGRREAFERSQQLRALEPALDADGLSTTARAVMARLRR